MNSSTQTPSFADRVAVINGMIDDVYGFNMKLQNALYTNENTNVLGWPEYNLYLRATQDGASGVLQAALFRKGRMPMTVRNGKGEIAVLVDFQQAVRDTLAANNKNLKFLEEAKNEMFEQNAREIRALVELL